MKMLTATILALLKFSPTKASHSPSRSTIRFCNRGYCYTKREAEHHHGLDKPLSPSEAIRINRQRQRMKRAIITSNDQSPGATTANGLNFCTDSHGSVMDCELFEILGLDPDEIDAEYEALECVERSSATQEKCTEGGEVHSVEEDKEAAKDYFFAYYNDGETIELDDLPRKEGKQTGGHISWRDRPQRGKCFDSDLGYTFDCNLVQILSEGFVLIEDLRLGGVHAAKPKTVFSKSHKKTNKLKDIGAKTPDVLCGSNIDPSEDWRTNVLLNLEGI